MTSTPTRPAPTEQVIDAATAEQLRRDAVRSLFDQFIERHTAARETPTDRDMLALLQQAADIGAEQQRNRDRAVVEAAAATLDQRAANAVERSRRYLSEPNGIIPASAELRDAARLTGEATALRRVTL
jgi:hypothetical protein